MKTSVVILSVITMILSSCTLVRFEKAQPVNTKALNEFPVGWIGVYISDDKDTLIVKSNSYKFGKEEESVLSPDHVVLKKIKGYFVLSYKDKEDKWDVLVIKPIFGGLDIYAIDYDKNRDLVIGNLKKIVPLREINKGEGSKSEKILINPSKREFLTLLKKDQFRFLGRLLKIN